jgi:hypothetical protein
MDPFLFSWSVDQAGYDIRRVVPRGLFGAPASVLGLPEYDAIVPRGGPERGYRALEEEGLWRRFAETCRTADGALSFANEYGLLELPPSELAEQGVPLNDFLIVAERLFRVAERLDAGDRLGACNAFYRGGTATLGAALPKMYAMPFPTNPGSDHFEYRLMPATLRDALLNQAIEALLRNRRFRRCRNEQCLNWFRLGPHSARDGGKTYTARREFCSDRCRVAFARRHKKESVAHA